jgi:hypothetical protein
MEPTPEQARQALERWEAMKDAARGELVDDASGVDPSEPTFGDMRVGVASWVPVGKAYIMPIEWIDPATGHISGLRPDEQ